MSGLLLDTHTFLWWMQDLPMLATAAREAIGASSEPVFVSAASAWEIEVKRARHALAAPTEVAEAVTDVGFVELPITISHAEAVRRLPPHHSDPFDRILVAQAQVERLTLVTRDHRLAAYGVPILEA